MDPLQVVASIQRETKADFTTGKVIVMRLMEKYGIDKLKFDASCSDKDSIKLGHVGCAEYKHVKKYIADINGAGKKFFLSDLDPDEWGYELWIYLG